jgi:Fe-S cluster biogenesis protein NfuA
MINVFIEPTPNPNALKFSTQKNVLQNGRVTLQKKEDCLQPLETALFEIKGVAQVHYFEKVITVTKASSVNWQELIGPIKEVISRGIDAHDPAKEYSALKEVIAESTEILKKINDVLDQNIRPALQGDGGDLEIVSYRDKVLTIFYQGACGGCPSSTAGTLKAIEKTLRDQVDPEIVVVPQEQS